MNHLEEANRHFRRLSNADKAKLAELFADKFKASLAALTEADKRALNIEAIADAAYAAARAELEGGK